jgi:hypothetical protein
MFVRSIATSAVFVAALALVGINRAAELTNDLKPGSVDLKSGGPLAFAPEGILLVSDPLSATIYAIDTGDTSGDPSSVKLNIDDIRGKIASLLGTEPRDVRVNDLAVNPLSGNVYVSVTRGNGPDAAVVLLRIDGSGGITELSLKNVKLAQATLPNPPQSRETRRGNDRMLTVTDMAYIDGRVFIAGLSNEEFASKLRSVPFPFTQVDGGTSVEIFHGAHGQIETRSPIMTFAPYEVAGEPHVLAAYTCTPLVKFPVAQLEPGTKVRGTTVAELGNRNRPLDMFVYQKDGKNYVLMANSSRGVMKISTDNVGTGQPITEHVSDGKTAGLPYDTIAALKGVVQLDRLNEASALALVQSDDGTEHLRTIALP